MTMPLAMLAGDRRLEAHSLCSNGLSTIACGQRGQTASLVALPDRAPMVLQDRGPLRQRQITPRRPVVKRPVFLHGTNVPENWNRVVRSRCPIEEEL